MHALASKTQDMPTLDHFALIDLPGTHSGIPTLKRLCHLLGYSERGHDYLADKQNDFMWLANVDETTPASDALPQMVIADFRLAAMPKEIATIITKYAALASPFPFETLETLLQQFNTSTHADDTTTRAIITLVTDYINHRPWPLPTAQEFFAVRRFNELLAWVLIFGHKPNHFTLSIHLQNAFASLDDFNQWIANECHLPLNTEGGKIKGTPASGVMQSSTQGELRSLQLSDGAIQIADAFMEFIWRMPSSTLPPQQTPYYWHDYYTDFIGRQANVVIESLYEVK